MRLTALDLDERGGQSLKNIGRLGRRLETSGTAGRTDAAHSLLRFERLNGLFRCYISRLDGPVATATKRCPREQTEMGSHFI